jgi:hypothetical protein
VERPNLHYRAEESKIGLTVFMLIVAAVGAKAEDMVQVRDTDNAPVSLFRGDLSWCCTPRSRGRPLDRKHLTHPTLCSCRSDSG